MGEGSTVLNCFECGSSTPASEGALCVDCRARDKAARASETTAGSTVQMAELLRRQQATLESIDRTLHALNRRVLTIGFLVALPWLFVLFGGLLFIGSR